MRIQEASENWVSGDGGERKGETRREEKRGRDEGTWIEDRGGGERLERRGKRGENAMRKEGRERCAGE
jgi:hypothetical protein